jgi:hypothetical protein
MLPFAYQVLVFDYDDIELNKTFPSLHAAFCCLTADYPSSRCGLNITVCYPDGSSVPLPLDTPTFRAENALDRDVLRREAKEMIEKDAEAQARFLKGLRGTVTGSPWLCDMGEDYVVNRLVKARQWRWRREDEINWTALEASLEKV